MGSGQKSTKNNNKMPKKINLIVLTLISFFFVQSHLLVAQSIAHYFRKSDKLGFGEKNEKLNDAYVHSAIIDEDNNEWFATEKGVHILSRHLNWGGYCLPLVSTYLVVEAPDDKVWFITHRNEIIIWGKKEDKNTYHPLIEKNTQDFNLRFLKDIEVSNLAFPKDSKTFWIASKGDGLWKRVGQDFTKVRIQKKDSPEYISDILLFDGKLWLATPEGLYYTEDRLTDSKSHEFIPVSDFTGANKMIVYQNQLWILGFGTDSKGTLKSTRNGKDWITYPTPEFFEYQVPNLMVFDSKSNLWVASDRVAKFEVFGDKSWTEYKEMNGFVGKNALSLAIEKRKEFDDIWLGTDAGGLYVLRYFGEDNKEDNPKPEISNALKTEKEVPILIETKKQDLSTLLKTETVEDIKGKQIQLKIQFEITKSTILPQYEDELNEIVRYMKKNTELLVLMQGHTAPIGDAQKNQKLSEERANEVKKYLVKQGINDERIKTYGYGDTQPFTTNTNQMSDNRRVEVMFYSVD